MAKMKARVSSVRIYSGTTSYEIKSMDGRKNYKFSHATPAGPAFTFFMPRDVIEFDEANCFGQIDNLPNLVERDKKFCREIQGQ